MNTIRCTVLSPIKYRGRVYRGGEVELPEDIAADQERRGSVKPAPGLVQQDQNAGNTPPATHNPESEPASREAGTGDRGAAVTTDAAEGIAPSAAEAAAPTPAPTPAKAPAKPKKAK